MSFIVGIVFFLGLKRIFMQIGPACIVISLFVNKPTHFVREISIFFRIETQNHVSNNRIRTKRESGAGFITVTFRLLLSWQGIEVAEWFRG